MKFYCEDVQSSNFGRFIISAENMIKLEGDVATL
jgi:hypothetical protein